MKKLKLSNFLLVTKSAQGITFSFSNKLSAIIFPFPSHKSTISHVNTVDNFNEHIFSQRVHVCLHFNDNFASSLVLKNLLTSKIRRKNRLKLKLKLKLKLNNVLKVKLKLKQGVFGDVLVTKTKTKINSKITKTIVFYFPKNRN